VRFDGDGCGGGEEFWRDAAGESGTDLGISRVEDGIGTGVDYEGNRLGAIESGPGPSR
jgi:hypothetical protein